jgi:outer membrane biosynthesis protein TonB
MRAALVVAVAPALVAGCATTYREIEPTLPQRVRIELADSHVPQPLHDKYAGQSLHAEARFYTDYWGATSRVELLQSTGEPAIDADVVRQLRFMQRGGQDRRITFRVPLDVLVEARPAPRSRDGYTAVPPHYFDGRTLYQPFPRLPDQAKINRKGWSEVRVEYVVFVEPDGSVSQVQPIASTPDVDPAVTATLMTWRFVAPNQRMRFTAMFLFRID